MGVGDGGCKVAPLRCGSVTSAFIQRSLEDFFFMPVTPAPVRQLAEEPSVKKKKEPERGRSVGVLSDWAPETWVCCLTGSGTHPNFATRAQNGSSTCQRSGQDKHRGGNRKRKPAPQKKNPKNTVFAHVAFPSCSRPTFSSAGCISTCGDVTDDSARHGVRAHASHTLSFVAAGSDLCGSAALPIPVPPSPLPPPPPHSPVTTYT